MYDIIEKKQYNAEEALEWRMLPFDKQRYYNGLAKEENELRRTNAHSIAQCQKDQQVVRDALETGC